MDDWKVVEYTQGDNTWYKVELKLEEHECEEGLHDFRVFGGHRHSLNDAILVRDDLVRASMEITRKVLEV
jgi:hypothetical protein